MTNKKHIFNKSIFSLFLVAIFFMGCKASVTINESTNSDADDVATDKSSLSITYGGADTASSVTQDVGLDTSGANATTITWVSSDTAVIQIDGIVIRAAGPGDTAITLTATISKGSQSAIKIFNVTVIQVPATDDLSIVDDVAALVIQYGAGDNINSVTQDVGLSVAGSSGTTISWSSNNAAIATNGTVTRPVFGSGDAVVHLIATVSKGGGAPVPVAFDLTVIETPQTNAEAVAADKAALVITYGGADSAGSVTLGVGLSTSGTAGSGISWASTNNGVIATNGTVNRPVFGSGDAVVTLTATITKGGTSDTQAFVLTVIEVPATDAEAAAADKAWVDIAYSGADTAASVLLDVGFPTLGPNNSIISWASDDVAINDITGVVTRPAFASGNSTVTLTATIDKNGTIVTKVIILTVIKLPATDTDAVIIDAAALTITYTGTDSAASVTLDVGLDIAGPNTTTISWASDDAAIATDGTVTRPATGSGNVVVHLIATVSKGGATPIDVPFDLTVFEVLPCAGAGVPPDHYIQVTVNSAGAATDLWAVSTKYESTVPADTCERVQLTTADGGVTYTGNLPVYDANTRDVIIFDDTVILPHPTGGTSVGGTTTYSSAEMVPTDDYFSPCQGSQYFDPAAYTTSYVAAYNNGNPVVDKALAGTTMGTTEKFILSTAVGGGPLAVTYGSFAAAGNGSAYCDCLQPVKSAKALTTYTNLWASSLSYYGTPTALTAWYSYQLTDWHYQFMTASTSQFVYNGFTWTTVPTGTGTSSYYWTTTPYTYTYTYTNNPVTWNGANTYRASGSYGYGYGTVFVPWTSYFPVTGSSTLYTSSWWTSVYPYTTSYPTTSKLYRFKADLGIDLKVNVLGRFTDTNLNVASVSGNQKCPARFQ
ncbi:MAG: immunoglobulin-like domain-containing protein [Leptospirales bacterium]